MDKPRVVIVGTIGHYDHSKLNLIAALTVLALCDVHEEPELPCIELKPYPELPKRMRYSDLHKKSKGDKRRDRAERRAKGWI